MSSVPSSQRQQPGSPVGVWVLLTLLFVVGVAALSFLPYHDKMELHTKGRLHPLGHALAFGTTAFLLQRIARSRNARIAALLLAMVFGGVLEYAQHVRYREPVEWSDVLFNELGVLLGAACGVTSTRRLKPESELTRTSDRGRI